MMIIVLIIIIKKCISLYKYKEINYQVEETEDQKYTEENIM